MVVLSLGLVLVLISGNGEALRSVRTLLLAEIMFGVPILMVDILTTANSLCIIFLI